MDKPNRDNSIKIKLNGEQQNFAEEPVEKRNTSSNDSFTKVIKINPEYIEEEARKETAAAQEPAEESFDWIIPESSDHEIGEYKIVHSKSAKTPAKKKVVAFSTISNKRNGGAWKSIIITAVFAILIGTSFGVLMLNLFITDGSKPAITAPVVVEKDSGKEAEETGGKTSSVAVGPQTMFVVQGGAFGSEEAANDGASQAVANGLAAKALGIGNQQFVFIGVADSLEAAKQLGAQYKANGSVEDAFSKQIEINEKTLSDISEADKGFLEAAPAVFQQLTKVTSNALLTSTLSEESLKSVSSFTDQINQEKITNEKVKNLQTDLTGAITKVKAYGDTKNEKSLVEAQQHLLNFLAVYYSL